MQALALIEHVDRELDLVSLLKVLLKDRHGVQLEIANFYADAPMVLARPAPRVVLTPFFYAVEDVVLKDYVSAWPDTRFVNLAWEQVFYPSHQAIKAPRDKFTRKKVTHLAWSRTFVDYMTGHGVQPERLKLVGHALYRLYRPPFSAFFHSREELAKAFGLDASKRWVFVPENYRWAFFTDAKLRKLVRRGPDEQELFGMRDWCRRSLETLMRWCDELGRSEGIEVIFRPRPATSVEEISGFARTIFGGAKPAFHMIKERTARDWTIASDVVASSYSTVLIEGALAGKSLVRVAPEPIPEGLRYDWCELVPEAVTGPSFMEACRGGADGAGSERLRAWAQEQFFPAGDPIDRLVEAVAEEVKAAHQLAAEPRTSDHGLRLPAWAASMAPTLPPGARDALMRRAVPGYFFNRETHEKDLFARSDVDRRVRRWRELLAHAQASAL
jgi:hypothetical protein